MGKMLEKYEKLLDSGEYSNIDEMCNDLALNTDDLYEDDDEENDD